MAEGQASAVAPLTMAQRMLEGSHGVVRDEKAAVTILEALAKGGDGEAMWVLGVCCEYGMGTEKDTKRACELYKGSAKKGSKHGRMLATKIVNRNGRGNEVMFAGGGSTFARRNSGEKSLTKVTVLWR